MQFRQAMLATLFAAQAALGAEHVAVKRPVNLPGSVDLRYRIDAKQRGFGLSGDAVVNWRLEGGKYTLTENTRAVLLGKILEHRSEGAVDDFGVAPASFFEKRFRKDPWTTTFDRKARQISFTESNLHYPIKGGEQDRSTATWQLLAMARAAPDKFVPGSEWTMFVAGRRDAEPWTFKVVNQEPVKIATGDVLCVHFTKAPPGDSKDQTVDLWLAPSLDWMPVRVRFTDADGDFVDQVLEKITRH
ncbi:MAG: DUF3108 domain-containing protein [Telluria sp.]